MNRELLELYSDYLNCSFGKVSATNLSDAIDNIISHDKITRFLSTKQFSNKDLWLLIKPTIREYENEQGVIIIDDTIIHKPHSQENQLICWHFDHCQNRMVKGINMLNFIYHYDNKTIPLSFTLIQKNKSYTNKNVIEKYKSEKTKNEYLLEQLEIIRANQIKYQYILTDSWFACNNTMKYIHLELKKHFICAVKTNRLIALSEQDKKLKNYVSIDSINWQINTPIQCWLKDLEFPVLLHRQIFKNKDNSVGYLYLVCNNLNCNAENIEIIYQKRWKIEVFYKNLKSNSNITKSLAHTITTQSNHIFASIYAVFKLEYLNFKFKLNHFAIKAKLYLAAIKASLQALNDISTTAPAEPA